LVTHPIAPHYNQYLNTIIKNRFLSRKIFCLMGTELWRLLFHFFSYREHREHRENTYNSLYFTPSTLKTPRAPKYFLQRENPG